MNMPEITTSVAGPRAPLFSTRKIVHISMLIFAFLLPYLTWTQAAGCALLALLFNVVVLPRLGVDLGKSPGRGSESASLNLELPLAPKAGFPPAHLATRPSGCLDRHCHLSPVCAGINSSLSTRPANCGRHVGHHGIG